MSRHPATRETDLRSDLVMISPSAPSLEYDPLDRKKIVRKIRTLENYLGSISKIKYGVANYVVGSGHRPIPETDSKDFNDRVSEEWKLWAENPDLCDRAGKNTLYDLQHLCVSGEMGDGEAFLLPQKIGESGYPQLLLVDPLLVGSPRNGKALSAYDGVKLDSAGRVLGYWLNSLGDVTNRFSTTSDYYAKNLVFHHVHYKRAGQVRGRSSLHAAARYYHDIVDLISMEISATKTHQSMAIHIKKKQGSTLSLENQMDEVDEDYEEQLDEFDDSTKFSGKASKNQKSPSKVHTYGADILEDSEIEEVNMLTSNRPSTSIKEFVYLIAKEAASSTEFPFEFLYDMSGLGGATARYSIADAYIVIKAKQQRLTRQVSYPVYRWWLACMIERGAFDDVEIPDNFWACDWQYPPKITVDIKHDSKSLIDLLSNGLTSETEIFDATGVSRSEHVKRRVEELKEVVDACSEADIPWQMYYQQFFKQSKDPSDNQPPTQKP